MKKPVKILLGCFLIPLGIIAIIVSYLLISEHTAKVHHIRQTKQQLLALAGNEVATRERVAKIKAGTDGRWTDDSIGITGDGYVFYYDLHNSHVSDEIPDTNILYLTDENRFIVSHKHICMELSEMDQLKSKIELLQLFRMGR